MTSETTVETPCTEDTVLSEIKEEPQQPVSEPMAPTTVCFVCTGNTCRSPMAQAYLIANPNGRKLRVLSAGLAAQEGTPISENAVLALEAEGIEDNAENPYRSHQSVQLDAVTVLSCDIIIGMSDAHAMQLMLQYPSAADKICSMPRPISDPYGGDLETYRTCLHEIAQGIREFFP